jgi:hypothetical protein
MANRVPITALTALLGLSLTQGTVAPRAASPVRAHSQHVPRKPVSARYHLIDDPRALRDPHPVILTHIAAVNGRGQVIGYYEDHDSVDHSFLWDHGIYTHLSYPHSNDTSACGINKQGDVVGEYFVGDTGHGFLWHRGVYSKIDVPGSSGTSLCDINDRGEIVGFYFRAADKNIKGFHGFLLSHGTFIQMPSPKVQEDILSQAEYINSLGQVAGTLIDNGGDHGFLWDHGTFTGIAYPHAAVTAVAGINGQGQVFGTYHDSHGASHGFVWNHGVYTGIDFPKPGMDTRVTGLDDRSEAVGVYEDQAEPFPHTYGFLLRNGAYTQIDAPAGRKDKTFLWGMNSIGDVFGTYDDAHGATHGFLLSHPDLGY